MHSAIAFPTELNRLARLFAEAGEPLYAVGGQVRNPLLGLPVQDRDICSPLPPRQVMAICAAGGIRCLPLGEAYGTVTLCMGGETFEHTVFRSDAYAPGGAHRPQSVTFAGTLETDAFRRDFTVNALYVRIPPEPGAPASVLDPTGRGLADIRSRLLRATSPDPADILRSDALRILRLARFACELGFTPEAGTLAAARAYAAGLADISAERVRSELDKILLSDLRYAAPHAGGAEQSPVYYGLRLLDEMGALSVALPELALCRGVAQREEYHAYDVLSHMLHACACARLDAADASREEWLTLRLAALLHDIGKPEARRRNADIPHAHGHMYGHDALGADMARAALARLRYPAAVTNEVCALIARHMFDLTGEAAEDTLRMRFAEWGYAHSLRLAALREADVRGSGRTPAGESVATAARFRRVLAAMRAAGAPFSEAELNCTGADIMAWTGLASGPRVGALKRALLRHCARRPQDNTRAALARLCRDMA